MPRQPPRQRLKRTLERIRRADEYAFYHDPVDPSEVPDYLTIISQPICIADMQQVCSRFRALALDSRCMAGDMTPFPRVAAETRGGVLRRRRWRAGL